VRTSQGQLGRLQPSGVLRRNHQKHRWGREGEQTTLFNCLRVCHTPPASGERQYKL
jgi:hypothetical protein